MPFNFKERIIAGQSGEYKGLANGFDRINKYIFNIQRSCYYLIGGLSGSAKTTFLDFILINAINDADIQKVPINVIYYSWEMDEGRKKASWLSILIYKKYGISIPPKKIQGYGEERLTLDEQMMVFSEIDAVEQLFNRITWVWDKMNPTGVYKQCWDYMSKRGVLNTEDYTDENGVKQKRIISFDLNNPKEYNLVIGDHMALGRLERGFSLKQNIDKYSEYSIILRNLFKMTIIWLQQFNQGLGSIERMKFKGVDISPQQTDFKDSTNPYTDADVVLGLMNAYKMDMTTCLGYNINNQGAPYNLKNSFRMLKIIKNRFERDDVAIGLLFKPETGSFIELPTKEEIGKNWIDKHLN